MARIVKLILAETHRGEGIVSDPFRIIPQLWTTDGRLVAEGDEHTGLGFLRVPFDEPRGGSK